MRKPDPVVVPFPRERIIRIRRKPQQSHDIVGMLKAVRW